MNYARTFVVILWFCFRFFLEWDGIIKRHFGKHMTIYAKSRLRNITSKSKFMLS
jgi:hypothetical protein